MATVGELGFGTVGVRRLLAIERVPSPFCIFIFGVFRST